jgi:hypothetical protein
LLSRSIDLRVIGDEDPAKLTAYLAEGDEVDIRPASTKAVCLLVSAAQQIPIKKARCRHLATLKQAISYRLTLAIEAPPQT